MVGGCGCYVDFSVDLCWFSSSVFYFVVWRVFGDLYHGLGVE